MKYPRSLYLEGVFGAHVIVRSEEEESYWRTKYGFSALDDPPMPLDQVDVPQEKAKRKYTRRTEA